MFPPCLAGKVSPVLACWALCALPVLCGGPHGWIQHASVHLEGVQGHGCQGRPSLAWLWLHESSAGDQEYWMIQTFICWIWKIWTHTSDWVLVWNYTDGEASIRILSVCFFQDGQSRTIRQFQFTDWPEQGVPKTGEGFIDFIGQVHKTKEQFGQDGPIAVHCRCPIFIRPSLLTTLFLWLKETLL